MLTNCYIVVYDETDLDYNVFWVDSAGNLFYSMSHSKFVSSVTEALSAFGPSDAYSRPASQKWFTKTLFTFTNYDDLVSNHPEYLL